MERGLPERFAKPIRAEHQKWKVNMAGCFAKSRSWRDRRGLHFVSSKRAFNNRPWPGLATCRMSNMVQTVYEEGAGDMVVVQQMRGSVE